ncbi:hypothetical protein ACFL1A_03255 [Patescibacteria group bacterium]
MKKGSISILVLVLGVTITAIIAGLVLVASVQYTSSARTEVFEKSLNIAQAGAEYYLWHLNHDPTDFTNDTGQHILSDPYGETDGTFDLTIDPPASGSSIITVRSQGWTNDYPDIKRTIKTRVGIPSVAQYAFLHNANLWFAKKTTIHGKIFSNGGIRMDATHDSTVQSAKSTYTCGTDTGCDPPEEKPGVWGDGGPQELWQFPVTPVDFNLFSLDFLQLKNEAEDKGLYLDESNAYGYHIIFSSNGSYDVKKVTSATSVDGWSIEGGCETLTQVIKNETNVGSYTISEKPIIFAEDHLWIEGIINGKVTVVAARFPIDINNMNIWLNDNLTYLEKDGNHNIGAIAQNNIIIPLDIPQVYELNGAYLAQSGKVLRHSYKTLNCSHKPKAVRQQLTVYGSIISNQRSYWNYGAGESGYGSDPMSGFAHREITYDPTLYYAPPPFFPTQGMLELISWEEE